MALPKRRHSHSRTRKRRSHDSLTATNHVSCSHCGEPKIPHRLCGACGTYKNRTVVQLGDTLE